MRVLDLHCDNAWFVVFLNGAVGVWALLSLKFPKLQQPALWWSIAVAELLIAVQVVLGVYLRTGAHLYVKPFHIFYGVVAITAVGIGYIYAKGSDWVKERRPLFYGILSLFLMGVAIRAIMQAGKLGCSPFT